MRRSLIFLVVVSLAAVACGDGSSAPSDTGSGSTGTTAVDVPLSTAPPTSAASTAGTTGEGSSTTSATVADDRPVAPDFSLDLGSGGTFVLSEETRPVYLVFWAEW